MKLFHGGLEVITKPKIIFLTAGRTLDFGSGFYTTTNFEQAQRWAMIRQEREQKQGVVSIFEVNDDLFLNKDLTVLRFETASREWLDFVMSNRMKKEAPEHNFDIVVGPVSNDRVYVILTLFELEQLSIEETLQRLKTYALVDQVLFHTERSLQNLHYIGSEVVS